MNKTDLFLSGGGVDRVHALAQRELHPLVRRSARTERRGWRRGRAGRGCGRGHGYGRGRLQRLSHTQLMLNCQSLYRKRVQVRTEASTFSRAGVKHFLQPLHGERVAAEVLHGGGWGPAGSTTGPDLTDLYRSRTHSHATDWLTTDLRSHLRTKQCDISRAGFNMYHQTMRRDGVNDGVNTTSCLCDNLCEIKVFIWHCSQCPLYWYIFDLFGYLYVNSRPTRERNIYMS